MELPKEIKNIENNWRYMMATRDYEGVTTVASSDIFKILTFLHSLQAYHKEQICPDTIIPKS